MSAAVHPHKDEEDMKVPVKAKSKKPKSFGGLIGFVRSLIFFVSGNFLELDDGIVVGLLERQKNELTNVALVGALLMTITFSYLPPILAWEDDWLKGAFAFSTSFCNCMVVCAVTLSISMLLVLNVLKNDDECRQFFDKLGKFALVPFQTLAGAIGTFGFIVGTLQFYKLINYDNWFIYIVVITYIPAVIIIPLSESAMMKCLTQVRRVDYKIKVLHVDKDQAKAYLNQYIETKFQGNDNLIPADDGSEMSDFLDYVKSSEDSEYLSRKGMINLKAAFVERLGELEY